MTVFDNITNKNIDELSDWFNSYTISDYSPWLIWWDENFCKKCDVEHSYTKEFGKVECAWCELNGKCKFFKEMNEIPNNKQVIKMWLQSECK